MKKVRYNYSSPPDPPAPFVHVSLAAPSQAVGLAGLAAQLDFGAYKTVVPQAAIERLGIKPLREVQVEGLGGNASILMTYTVELTIRDLSSIVIEVLSSEGEPYVLVGRDVLNRYRIEPDGPALKLLIEEP